MNKQGGPSQEISSLVTTVGKNIPIESRAYDTVKEGFGNQINLCRDRILNPGLPAQKSDTLPLDHQVTAAIGEYKTILERKNLSTTDRDSNLEVPVIGRLIYCESMALDQSDCVLFSPVYSGPMTSRPYDTCFSLSISVHTPFEILLIKPLNAAILRSNQPLSADKKYDIVCQSVGSRPPAKISWWMDNRRLENYVEKYPTSPHFFPPLPSLAGRVSEISKLRYVTFGVKCVASVRSITQDYREGGVTGTTTKERNVGNVTVDPGYHFKLTDGNKRRIKKRKPLHAEDK
uniref:Ig-like domain-containing protein n=1 Tax=Timema cristinae TaxID=61476 RepID=A0A7R9CEX1_TIMCR|nr:unnamed protein product [Timema cristinae]